MPAPTIFPPHSRRLFLRNTALLAGTAVLPRVVSAAGETASTRKLGVALVGLGSYSTGQLGPALRETKHCRLAGVVTGDADKGRRWATDYGFPASSVYHYETMDQLADNPDIDIVYVVTPNALHAEHSIKAARAGKHVISEKPFTVSVAEADAVIAACRDAGVKLSIGYRLHFDPYHAELRRLARSGEVGPFRKMSGNFSFVMGRPQWRAQHALSGGGPLMDLGVYVLQEAMMATAEQPPVAVMARSLPKERPDFFRDVEETLEWTMEFSDGRICEARTSYNDNGNLFRAEAERGWFHVEPAYSYGGLRGATHDGTLQFPRFNQQAAQMDDFARCIAEDRESPVSGAMGRRDMVVIEAIYAAMRSGQREPVNV